MIKPRDLAALALDRAGQVEAEAAGLLQIGRSTEARRAVERAEILTGQAARLLTLPEPRNTAPKRLTMTHAPADPGWLDIDATARHFAVSVRTITRWTELAPPGLPGGPVNFGTGKKRHLRWPAATLDAWAAAVQLAREPAPLQICSARPPKRLSATPPARRVRSAPSAPTSGGRLIDRVRKAG